MIRSAGSEAEWDGKAGDNFRTKIEGLGKSSGDLAERAREAAKALDKFADELRTVKVRMTQAASVALESGLAVTPNPCDPVWIGDPEALPPMGPYSIELQTRIARQVAAYADAQSLVAEGREKERVAHEDLRRALSDTENLVDRIKDDLENEWHFLGVQAGAGYVEAAVKQADKWTEIAQTRAASAGRYQALAAEYGMNSGQVRAAFAPGVEAAEGLARSNAALVGGKIDSKVARFSAMALSEGGESAGSLSKLGSKLPLVGVGLTGFQTLVDVRKAEDGGDAALAVAKNGGGFIAGTAATSLLLASAAGGPAAVAAVGVGVLVGYGVGELIEWAGGE